MKFKPKHLNWEIFLHLQWGHIMKLSAAVMDCDPSWIANLLLMNSVMIADMNNCVHIQT